MTRTRINLFWILMTIGFSTTGLSESYPIYRKDLNKFSSLICKNINKDLSTILNQNSQLIDSHVSIQIIQAKKNQSIKTKDIQSLAKDLAKSNLHHGYAFGLCSKKNAWVISVPSPLLWNLSKNTLTLSTENLKKFCYNFQIDFINKEKGNSRKIPINGKNFQFKTNPENIYSFTCFPRKPNWLGPIQWGLMNANLDIIPHQELVNGKKKTSFISWVNEIRKDHQIPQLSPSSVVNQAAKELGRNLSIHHNKHHIAKIKQKLTSKHFNFLGENRAGDIDLERIARLFWLSPQHRSLLLNEDATHIGVFQYGLKTSFITIIMAKKITQNSKKI